jgi:hypothetical protein
MVKVTPGIGFSYKFDRRKVGGAEMDYLLSKLGDDFKKTLSDSKVTGPQLKKFANETVIKAKDYAPIGKKRGGTLKDLISSSVDGNEVHFSTDASRKTKTGGNAPYGWYQELGYRTFLPAKWKVGVIRRSVHAQDQNLSLSSKEQGKVDRAIGREAKANKGRTPIKNFFRGVVRRKSLYGRSKMNPSPEKHHIGLQQTEVNTFTRTPWTDSETGKPFKNRFGEESKLAHFNKRTKATVFYGGTKLLLKHRRTKAGSTQRAYWWHPASNNDEGYIRKALKEQVPKEARQGGLGESIARALSNHLKRVRGE